jgi:hypothetical protein
VIPKPIKRSGYWIAWYSGVGVGQLRIWYP